MEGKDQGNSILAQGVRADVQEVDVVKDSDHYGEGKPQLRKNISASEQMQQRQRN